MTRRLFPGHAAAEIQLDLAGVLPSVRDNLLSLVSLPIVCGFTILTLDSALFSVSTIRWPSLFPIEPLLSSTIFSVGRLYYYLVKPCSIDARMSSSFMTLCNVREICLIENFSILQLEVKPLFTSKQISPKVLDFLFRSSKQL